MYTPDDLTPQLECLVDDQLFVAQAPLRFAGLPMGTRMTACRLEDGGLFVHSPIRIDLPGSRVADALEALGEPRYVVAPNFLHHLFAGPFVERYPNARLFVSPKLARKRADLPFEAVLEDEPPKGTWADTIDQALAHGSRIMDEVAFCHRPSRTLILTDLLMSSVGTDPWWMRLAGTLLRIHERPSPPIEMRLSFRDKVATRGFVEKMLSWDFDRIVVGHGPLIESGAKDVLRRAYAFCLG